MHDGASGTVWREGRDDAGPAFHEPGADTASTVTRDAPVSAPRVLMLPDASKGNPYQRQLRSALERRGARVRLANPAGVLPLLGAVRRHGPVDVLHLHWTHRLVVGATRLRTLAKATRFLGELLTLRLRGVSVVWTAHNLLEHERRQPGIELACGRLATRLYKRVIVHCGAARRQIADAYRLPVDSPVLTQAPHGHFIGAYGDGMSRDEARQRLGIEADGPVFLHFGQIRPYKGVFELLDCFARLDSPGARLLIAGRPWDDATAAALRARAAEDPRIQLVLEFIPDEDVGVYLAAADAMVLPYRDILTSGSAMLAISFARAVVMPRCGCAEEMLGDDAGALLYDPYAADGLAGAMERAVTADLDALGAAGRARAEGFDWDTIARTTLDAYLGYPAHE
ncbi:glycosyltransferase [Arhodomonas sp. AD133]|uniref:glycosyltransferase n=1 Tax=Arhodomonas sp. AD133 TaxID=3415009 RepID=UPI003EBE1C4E